ncbi:MAG: WYL domain-containing protein [Myxococcota bacterium]|nr:WYL domain-containing protein [Myxococcota bacterium]
MRGEQLSRQWRLIQRLAKSRYGVGLDELADDLECVRRTVYRDLDALMAAGFPVVSERREGRSFYRFLDTFQLGDVPFTPDEILSLAFGEDLLRTLEGTVFHDSIRSALEKIRASLGPELTEYLGRLGESFRVLPGPHENYAALRDTIRTLNEAVLDHHTVCMHYRTGSTGREKARDLDPYRVFYRSGALYVMGHDHLSGELRTFAVGRIRSIEPTTRRFDVPASFDFDAYVGSSFGVIAEPPVPVRIRFDKRWASWVSERTWHRTQQVVPRRGGGIELTMEVGGVADLRTWVLSFGAGAEVLEPASLREDVQRELERAAARYARR